MQNIIANEGKIICLITGRLRKETPEECKSSKYFGLYI